MFCTLKRYSTADKFLASMSRVKFWHRTRAASEWDFPPYTIWKETRTTFSAFQKCMQKTQRTQMHNWTRLRDGTILTNHDVAMNGPLIKCQNNDVHWETQEEHTNTRSRREALMLPQEDYATGTSEEIEINFGSKKVEYSDETEKGKDMKIEKGVQLEISQGKLVKDETKHDVEFFKGFQKCISKDSSRITFVKKGSKDVNILHISCLEWTPKWWHWRHPQQWTQIIQHDNIVESES